MSNDRDFPLTHCICPSCGTWLNVTPARCPNWDCQQPIAWVAELPELCAALAGMTHRQHLLEVIFHDAGRPETLCQPATAPMNYTGRGGNEWRFRTVDDHQVLLVEHAGRTTRLHLPFHDEQVDGAAVSGRTLLKVTIVDTRPRVTERRPDSIPLRRGQPVSLGRGKRSGTHYVVADRSVEVLHCWIADDPAGDFWLVDADTAHGTFLNGQPIFAAQLKPWDVLQLGRFAWTYDAQNSVLMPLAPISGAEVAARKIAVSGRLDPPLDLHIDAGQFVAIVGASGAGKSSLLKALLSGPGARHEGTVKIREFDSVEHPEEFRAELGYVSQEPALHRDLLVEEAVQFSAAVRGKSADSHEIERRLEQLEIESRHWKRPTGELSGGELKRVRVAAELVGQPPCLLLDEPASGLDSQTERKLMRLLRQLSFQGCTILIVTHNLEQLDWVDRVLVLRNRRVDFDGSPIQFREHCPGPSYDLDRAQFPATTNRTSAVTGTRQRRRPAVWTKRCWDEAWQLGRREMVRLKRSWRTRLLVPLVLLPLVFAALLVAGVKVADPDLLGFLAVLSCIWMGGSLSLTTIVDERDVVDYERLLFLHFIPYFAVKVIVNWLLAILQTVAFAAFLYTLRRWCNLNNLNGLCPWGVFTLLVVSWAAVGLGLVISAIAKSVKSKELAHFLFPMVMMCQFVLSVHVSRPEGHGLGLQEAYGHFSWHDGNDGRPTAASVGSYLTLSRFGDVALRSFAYERQEYERFVGRHRPDPIAIEQKLRAYQKARSYQWKSFASASIVLLLQAAFLPILAGLVLWLEEQFRR